MKEVTDKQIITAKKIIQLELQHRIEDGEQRNHHDISKKNKRILEMQFLEKILICLWEKNETYRKQTNMFSQNREK